MRARFTLSGAKAQQIEVALDGTTLVLHCTNEKGETAVASVETRLQTGKWYWLGVTQAKKGLWKSSLAVYLDGTCVYDEKFTYLENFDGGGKSNYVVYFAKSFSGTHISNKNEWACAAGVRRSYRFQLCSMGLLTGACSEQEMSSLFQLHRSRTFSLTEVTADEQWKAAQQRLLERVSDCNRADD